LDLACGDGRHSLRLSESSKRVVALDLSLNSLKMAVRECQGRENIAFIHGSAFEPPFPAHLFDGIWYSQAFEYVPPDRRASFFDAIGRILKPAGLLYMSVETWMHPSPWRSLKELWSDFRLFCYWKFVKRKPLWWGEFLYPLPPRDVANVGPAWHYHVHTDRWTLRKLLQQSSFEILQLDNSNGYFYTLFRRASKA
jgi:ubiquinone/menaquinone biosynthesis C-methylase UbiE